MIVTNRFMRRRMFESNLPQPFGLQYSGAWFDRPTMRERVSPRSHHLSVIRGPRFQRRPEEPALLITPKGVLPDGHYLSVILGLDPRTHG